MQIVIENTTQEYLVGAFFAALHEADTWAIDMNASRQGAPVSCISLFLPYVLLRVVSVKSQRKQRCASSRMTHQPTTTSCLKFRGLYHTLSKISQYSIRLAPRGREFGSNMVEH